jgi:glycosyltransferase involved in cell wall biosynthesis
VTATRVGGGGDLVRHDDTGLRAEPGDGDAIARYITAIGSDAALRQRLAGNALIEIQRYRWPLVIDAVDRELRAIVRAAARSTAT